MKKHSTAFTSAIAAALSLFGASGTFSSLFGLAKGSTPNRYQPRRSNSTEITNHNAAIDEAKRAKKARRAGKE